jgi:hypothetical protein
MQIIPMTQWVREARERLGDAEFDRLQAEARRLARSDAAEDQDGDDGEGEPYGWFEHSFFSHRYLQILVTVRPENREKFIAARAVVRRAAVAGLIERGLMI